MKPEQIERIKKATDILGEESALENLFLELHWSAVDMAKLQRSGSMKRGERRERFHDRLAQLMTKCRLVGALPWIQPEVLEARVEESILRLEEEAARRIERRSKV